MNVSGPLPRIVHDEVSDPGAPTRHLALVPPAADDVAELVDLLPTPDLAIPATALAPAPAPAPAPARAQPRHRFVPVLVPMPDAAPRSPPPSIRRPLDQVVAEIELQPRSPAARIAKRSLDVLGSALGLIVLSPVLLLLALAVKLTSRGPVLFVHKRCGLGGRPFPFYKLRTMVADAEARKRDLEHLNEMTGPVFKIRRDPRITPLGRVLRKLSLDELPQLWNVLRGDMSLVGPRPPTLDEVERYTPRQVQRLSVMSGITGLWQVSGRSNIADFERWIDLDLEYVRSWSIWLDLRILLKTVLVVAFPRGAH